MSGERGAGVILGIESSCDETAVGLVDRSGAVLSNVIASQHDLHREYAGVVPEIASRAHVERILPVVDRAVSETGLDLDSIDAIGVGNRPGLIGALLVGVAAAKSLAWSLNVPVVGVDHVESHLFAGLLRTTTYLPPELVDVLPALGLVVSGGHTSLFIVENPMSMRAIGITIDDAIGEAFDKVATMLGLCHPGGPAIDALARRGDDRSHDFPVSRLAPDSLDFSYSGLKTSVLYTINGTPRRGADGSSAFERDHTSLREGEKADIAASFERAAVRAVILKLGRAVGQSDGSLRGLLVGGGVSANTRLRSSLEEFADQNALRLVLPPIELCLDNAAMIAGRAFHLLDAGQEDTMRLAASPSSLRRPAQPA